MRRAALAAALTLLASPVIARERATAPQAAPDDGLPLGTLPRQSLSPGECGIFLWKAGPSGGATRLLLMAKATPPQARIVLDGRVVDLPRTGTAAPGENGLPPSTSYSDGSNRLSLELTFAQSAGLTQGATIPGGTLRLDRADGSSVVVPVTGLLGCQ